MKKTEDTRYQAEERFIEDKFFSKGHLWQKFYIGVLTIIGWLAVAVPIYWTVTSTLLRNEKNIRPIWSYREGIAIYFLMNKWLLVSFSVVALGALVLTMRNNYKTKHHLKKEVQYDQEKLAKREAVFEELYLRRFGTKEQREQARYYSVPKEKNLADDFIHDAYKKEDVNK